LKKILYIVLGCISVGLGALGAVLPVLPTFPFLMLTAFCFARSSEKLDRWFRSTKLYEENLKDFVAGKGMTKKTKIRIMVTVTLLMSIASWSWASAESSPAALSLGSCGYSTLSTLSSA